MMATLTLYSIEAELICALDTIEMLDGPDDGGLRAELELDIARMVSAELRKVDGVARMLAHFESQADLAACEIKRLQTRKRAMESHHERLEACVRLAMECAGKTELQGDTATLTLRKNPAAVYIRDFAAVPAEFRVQTISESIDKAAVKRAIASGVDVAGAELVQGDRLVIR